MSLQKLEEPPQVVFETVGVPTAESGEISDDKLATEMGLEKKDFVILHPPQAVQWSSLLYMICLLPNQLKWQSLVMLTALVNFFIATTCIYFARHMVYSFLPAYIIFDLIYLIDVILLYLHRYWKSLQARMFTKQEKLYWIILDTISLIPLELFAMVIFGLDSEVVVFCRCITFIRLRRMDMFLKALSAVQRYRWKVFLVGFILMMAVLHHISVCIWYQLSCHHGRCQTNNMTSIYAGTWAEKIVNDISFYEEAAVSEWYRLSLYGVLEFHITLGLGDIKATNMVEMVWICVFMLTGYFFYDIYLLSFTVKIVTLMNLRVMEYNFKIRGIKMYLQDARVKSAVGAKISEYYTILWEKKGGMKRDAHFDSLPTPLQTEVMYDINCAPLHRSVLLGNLKEVYLRSLSLIMKHEFLLPGDIVYYQGVVKSGMIIIMSGVLEILSDEDDESPIIAFQAGTVMGESSLFLTLPSTSTLRAVVYTEIQMVNKVDFTRLMMNYPVAFGQLRKMIVGRIQTGKSHMAKIRSMRLDRSLQFVPIKYLKDRLIAAAQNKSKGMAKVKAADKVQMTNDIFYSGLLDLYQITNEDSNLEKPVVCLNYDFPYILDATSSLIRTWEAVVAFVHMTFLIFFPYETIFLREISDITNYIMYFSDIVCALDLAILTCTTVPLKNTVLTKFKQILIYRLKTIEFYLTILPVFPYGIMLEAVIFEDEYIGRIFGLLILVKTTRICRCIYILRKMEHYYSSYVKIFLSSTYSGLQLGVPVTVCCLFEAKALEQILMKHASPHDDYLFVYVIALLKLIASMWVVTYIIGCIYYLSSCLMVVCTEDTWFYNLMLKAISKHEENPNYLYPLASSMYLAFSTVVHFGAGDILPAIPADMYITIIVLIFGLVAVTYLLALLSSAMSSNIANCAGYKLKVHAFQRFLEHYQVPSVFRSQVQRFFSLQWYYDFGQGRDNFHNTAPSYLKLLVLREELYELMSKVPLFQFVDVDFLMNLIQTVRVQLLPEDSNVCYAGDVGREMFIVHKGNCVVLNQYGMVIHDLQSGDYYGDIEMLFGLSKMYTLKTTTHCKIISLSCNSYNNSLSMFPLELETNNMIMNDLDVQRALEKLQWKKMTQDDFGLTPLSKKKKLFKQAQDTVGNSFIWTYNVYNTTGQREKYWDPFRALGKWQLLGIFLLPFTIHPSGRIIKVWFALRFFLLVSMAAIVPLILGLPPAGKDFTVILLLVEYTAYIEIYLLLHVAYYNEHGLLISHPLETAKHYLSHSFLIDVIGALPLPHILLWYNPDHTDRDQDPYLDMILPHAHYCMYRAIALLQNHRIVGGLVFLQGDTLSIYSLASYVLVMPLVLLMLFCASLRIVTECDFRFFLTQFPERKHSERIFENIGPYKNTTLYGYLFCGDKSWMKNTRFTNPDPAIVLMLAFFWIINIFSRVGTGAIPASDSFDMISSIVVAMFGICVFSYWLGFLSGESQRVYGLALSYQQKVQELLNFLEREMVEEDKITKMFKYFEYIWKRTSGMESKEMVEGLNSALREDITLGLYENILREVPIFKHVERSFLRVFAKHFHEEYFLRGDILIKCYDVQTTIYIVLRGRVEILTPYHDLIDTIGVGGMFGNIHGASLGCSSATFVAAGYVDLLGISSDTFFLVLRDYKTVQIILDELLLSASDYILPSAHTDFVSTTKARKLHANINEEEVEVEVKAHDYNQLAVELPHTVASLVKASSIHMGVHVPDNILLVMLLFFNPRKWFKFALEPSHTGIRYIWIMTYLACCIQCIFIPYMFVTQNFDIYIFTGTLLVEPIFYLRIFVFLHEAYMDEFGVYVKKFRLIAKHYFSDFYRVFWDIVPNLPIYLFFVLAKPGDRMFVFSYLRLYNLLRYKYILTFFKVLSTPLMAPRAPILLLKTITIFWTFVHGFALSSLMIFIPYGDLSRNTREYLKEANCFEAYVYCLYYVLSNVTTTGIGDITPLTKSELVLSITILIFTKISFSYLVVCCLMIIQMKAQHVLSYEFKVVRMKQFLENQDLSSHLMDKLWVYVRNLWSREAGLHLPELLEKAPYVLHCEIKTKIYSGHLRKGFLFKDINEALLNQICGRLQRVVFFPGNYIVQHGDTDSAMYVIHRGQVSVLTVHPNLTETRHEMLYVSEMFGITQGLNYGLAHRFSYRAETHCDILILSLPSWDFVLNQFPADKEIIYRRMHNAYATF